VDDATGLTKLVTGVFCVTGSVAVGTPRDSQDATGRDSIIELYLPLRADFTKEFANSRDRPIRFSRPRMTLVRKTSAFESPERDKTRHSGRVIGSKRDEQDGTRPGLIVEPEVRSLGEKSRISKEV
jgi:hypothetical protein